MSGVTSASDRPLRRVVAHNAAATRSATGATARAHVGAVSAILSQWRSRLTGQLEPHPYRPRVRVTARNSRSAFFRLMRPNCPHEWPQDGRFLDVHTLAAALYDESYSLDRLCGMLKIPG